MKYLNRVRKPETHSTLQSKLLMIAGALLLGACLGTFSKYLDYRQAALPGFLQQIDASLDLHNFLGTFAPWIVIAVFLSIKSPSPFQACANVFAFFVGMVASYYLYSNYVAGFFPKSYAMIWVGFTLLSPILAFFCWYAKGTGWLAIVISAGILGFLINCTLVYGMRYVDLRSALHLVTLILGGLMLRRRSGKEALLMVGLSIPAAILLNLLIPFYF